MSLPRLLSVLLLAATASAQRTESPRERWERMDPAERARIEQRFEDFRKLDADHRRALEERARGLRETEQRLQRELSPEVRRRLAGLDPERRREVLREMLESEARQVGRRVRERMPEPWIELLRDATPGERALLMERFRREHRERSARQAIEHLGRRLELGPSELERLKSLAPEEQARAVLELRKRASLEEGRIHGPPSGVSEEEWRAMRDLPPPEFFDAMQRNRQARGWRPPFPPAPEARARAARRLFEALRPRPEDVLDLAELAPAERERRLSALRRERCLAALRETGLAPDEEIARLEKLPPHELFERLRGLLHAPPPRRGDPREGRPRPERP